MQDQRVEAPQPVRLCGEDVVRLARGWIGTPYHHQASLKGVGTDCLGLVRGVWREIYGSEPERFTPYTRDWSATGDETLLIAARRHFCELAVSDIGAGDVVVFRYRARAAAKHCGVLTGAGLFIHAIEGAPVCEVTLTPWWRRRLVAAFRFPGVA